ncbi:MAG: glutamyl-tRNA reductase [Ilumatobacteraceae bacterium]
MSIVVIGVNHRTGPLDLLERVAVPGDEVPKAVIGLTSRQNIREAVVLTTCNRTEVYAVAEKFHGAYADIRDFFCELSGLPADQLHAHLYSQHDDGAIRHLFEVAAGLDSAVLGESEILGQVRHAWDVARAEGGAKATLNLLFRTAVEVGKRVRTETAIGRGTASVSHAAVEMATEQLGSLAGKRVLVVGAGDMGEGIATALVGAGATDICVINRTLARAEQLAQRVNGRVVPFGKLPSAISAADVLLTCTGAGTVLVDVYTMLAGRIGVTEPLLVVDIAVPRDVAPEVTEIDGVTLLNLDHLRDWADRGLAKRATETERVRAIVAEEIEGYLLEAAARQAAPLVAALHEQAEAVRVGELQRFASRLATLDDAQRVTVDAVTKGVVAKLLHQLSVRLKADAGTPQGERNAAAVRDLFELP